MPSRHADGSSITIRQQALREAAGTLTGHAAGQDTMPTLDHAAVARAINAGTATAPRERAALGALPEPFAAIADYLGDDLDPDGRDFVPTSELLDVLEIDPKKFAQQMTDAGCRPTRDRVTSEDGETRQVRGYLTADIRRVFERVSDGGEPADEDDRP